MASGPLAATLVMARDQPEPRGAWEPGRPGVSSREGIEGLEPKAELPQAREAHLVVRQLNDEILVYDLERHKASFLSPRIAWVWRQCDGKTTREKIASRLARELQVPVGEGVIQVAIRRLARAHLLHGSMPGPLGTPSQSRREWIRRATLLGWVAMTAYVLP